eukprot:gene21945-8563_t
MRKEYVSDIFTESVFRLWDLDGTEVRKYEGHTKGVFGAVMVGGNKFLSWSMDRSVRLWGLDAGTELQ